MAVFAHEAGRVVHRHHGISCEHPEYNEKHKCVPKQEYEAETYGYEKLNQWSLDMDNDEGFNEICNKFDDVRWMIDYYEDMSKGKK